MDNIRLAPYRLRVRKARHKGTWLPVDDFGGTDLVDVLQAWLSSLKNAPIKDQDTGKHLEVLSWEFVDESKRDLRGILGFGGYGSSDPIVTAGSNQVNYTMAVDDVRRRPLYFRFFVPNGKKEAIFVLEKVGKQSLYHFSLKHLHAFMRAHYGEFTLEWEQFVNLSILEDLLSNNPILDIVVKTFGVSSDIAAVAGMSADSKRKAAMETRIDLAGPTAGVLRNSLKALLEEPNKTAGFLALPVGDEAQVKVTLETDAGPRVLNMDNPWKFNFEIDVTKRAWTAQAKEAGIPDFDRIDEAATMLIEDRIKKGSVY